MGIIGLGHVGTITAEALRLKSRVFTYDIAESPSYPSEEFAACDFLVVCVNTPSGPGGGADLSQVHDAFECMPDGVPVVVRSTVPPGTCDGLAAKFHRDVIFWPEYMGETQFVVQTMDQLGKEPFHIVGATDSSDRKIVGGWVDLIAETYGPLCRTYQVRAVEAEIIKYMENSFFAVKTTFVNEFRALAEHLGADWQSVREGWLLDPRIERDHSDAFKSAPGYGGRCLPKDVSAILARAEEAGMTMPLLNAVRAINTATTSPPQP